jgi:PAS domain S-box-containing protein
MGRPSVFCEGPPFLQVAVNELARSCAFERPFTDFRRLAQLCACLSILALWGGLAAAAEKTPRNVLVLFSNEAELPANQILLRGLHKVLSENASDQPTTYTEFLDLVRFPSEAHQNQLAGFMKEKFAGARIDLAIVAARPALDFLSKFRDEIIPGVPIVFAAIGRDDLQNRALPAAATGIVSRWDIAKTVELAIGLQPDARQILVVTGASNFDKLWEQDARQQLRSYEGRFSVTYLAALPLADVLSQVSRLPRSAIIIVPIFLEDGDGVRYIPRDVIQKMTLAASAPIYATYDPAIGLGVVGGYMDTFEQVGRATGHLALRILNGEKPETIVPYEAETHRYIVDWRQLQHWGLDESALPPGTEIRYKQPTAWEQYESGIILIAVALLLQSILILKFYAEARKRRLAEQQAQASNERMDLAISAVDLGVWDWDLKADTIWATKSCLEMFGLRANEPLTRRPFADTIPPEDRSRVQSEIDDAIAKRQPFETEYRIVLPNEPPRWIATKGSPREDEGEGVRRLVEVVHDVTARKQAELEAEQQRQELAHLTRVSILGALSGALAHELNQPLTAILANAEAATYILSQDPVDMEEIRQILQDIAHDDKRAGDVIKHLRALLKKDEGLMQTISVNDLVAQVLALAHSDLILKDVAVSKQLGYELPAIYGDPVQLQQVLLNLIINACEAMSGKPTGDRLLSVETASNGNGEIRVSIGDTGEGISPAVSEKLFDPFYTTKTLGLGLGLPICRSIITAHGGRLWAEPANKDGAVFHVELPIQTGSHA